MTQFLQILIGGLVQGSVFAVIALGLSLVSRVTGIINLAQGGFCAFSALLLYSLEATFGWPVPLAVLGAVIGTTIFGLALGATTFVPALRYLPNSSMLMLTAGLLTVLEGVTLLLWGSQPYAVPPFSSARPIAVIGLTLPTQALWIAAACALVIVGAWYVLARTAVGRALTACAENPFAARLLGVEVTRLTLLSFGAAAMIAAIGGSVVAPIMSLQFDAGR